MGKLFSPAVSCVLYWLCSSGPLFSFLFFFFLKLNHITFIWLSAVGNAMLKEKKKKPRYTFIKDQAVQRLEWSACPSKSWKRTLGRVGLLRVYRGAVAHLHKTDLPWVDIRCVVNLLPFVYYDWQISGTFLFRHLGAVLGEAEHHRTVFFNFSFNITW